MMPEELPGDTENMPRIQAPSNGASQRMGVSPGREQDGYMHMPCGQSGHPLSPHYRDMHESWVRGQPTPFLPGETINTLLLKPAA
jgi:penicillin amidase